MFEKEMRRTAIVAIAWMVLAFTVVTTSTYAWFTKNTIVNTIVEQIPGAEGNGNVNTSHASGTAENQSIQLLLSESSTGTFATTCDIVQVNATNKMNLLPVSTANLKEFYKESSIVNNQTTGFALLQNEECYYHGRIYLKAQATGFKSTQRLKVYLDMADGMPVTSSQELLNAGRLGLTVDEADPVIISLSQTHNNTSEQVRNTYLNGVAVPDDCVLASQTNLIVAVTDPSIDVNTFTLDSSASSIHRPDNYIINMKLNQVYQIDVYFYLEGCDPDCSSALYSDELDLYLAFYGILA